MQRNVVSFTINQVQSEIQLMTLLEDLKCITSSKWSEDEYTYKDLLYVIEEIDTDERGLCMQRSTTPVLQVVNTEDEGSGDVANQPEEPLSKRGSRASKSA